MNSEYQTPHPDPQSGVKSFGEMATILDFAQFNCRVLNDKICKLQVYRHAIFTRYTA